MKKLFYILAIFLPSIFYAQQPWYKSSPLDYMWKNVGNAGFSSGQAGVFSIAFSPSGQPYVAYMDFSASYKATVMKFDGTNWVTVGNAGFSAGEAFGISLSFSPSAQPYVAYTDSANSWKATVMKFDGNNWVNIGITGFSAGAADHTSLAFSPSDGKPYVGYRDSTSSYKATVMTYDGTNWVNVGNAGFSTSVANFTSLVFSPSDSQPYVAFQDWQTSSGSATVMKFDGINWVNVGNDRFSAGQAAFISLAFSPSGQPYVGFIDSHTNPPYKATVMKFDGANWVNVGNEGFSAGYVGSTSLAFSQSGQPYIAYEDGGNSGKATVMKFDGTNWVDLGNEGFSDSTAYSTCLAISQSGEPYVAYTDVGNSEKATVMKFDSVYVGINEPQKSQLFVYPIPAIDKITVELSLTPANSQLSIMNFNGEEVLTRSLEKPKTQIDISNLPSGVYFVRLTNDKTTIVEKFLKQ